VENVAGTVCTQLNIYTKPTIYVTQTLDMKNETIGKIFENHKQEKGKEFL
jgi:hypothetical protein